jgi:hypothetical protein
MEPKHLLKLHDRDLRLNPVSDETLKPQAFRIEILDLHASDRLRDAA